MEKGIIMNQINVILPYRHAGGWAFDDDATGLLREPFIAGADKAIDKIVDQLGIKGDKIKMMQGDKNNWK